MQRLEDQTKLCQKVLNQLKATPKIHVRCIEKALTKRGSTTTEKLETYRTKYANARGSNPGKSHQAANINR